MVDVSRVINFLCSKYISLKSEDVSGEDVSFSPSSLLTSLLANSWVLKFSKAFRESSDLDMVDILADQEKLSELIEQLPKMEINDSQTVFKSTTCSFLYNFSDVEKSQKHQEVSQLFGALNEFHEFGKQEEFSKAVNEWLKAETGHKKLHSIDYTLKLKEATKFFCICNCLTISAQWKFHFDVYKTSMKNFYSTPDSPIEVETMYLKETLRVGMITEVDAKVVEIPLQTADLSVLIIFTAKKDTPLSFLMKKFDALFLDDCISLLNYEKVTVLLPKFKISSQSSCIATLNDFGLFDDEETGQRAARLDDYVQDLRFSINESGLSTKQKSNNSSLNQPDEEEGGCMMVTHKINHPFLFIIYDSYYRCARLVCAISQPAAH